MSQGIVIQGPTGYCREVAPLYQEIANVVWSTWEDEPQENITFIQQYMPVVLNEKPSFPGYLNINMQTISTVSGIKFLKDRGVSEVLKTRGDLKISDISKMLSVLKGRQGAFMVLCKKGTRPDLYYELVYEHYSHDYPDNFCTYGTIDNIYNAFNFTVQEMSYIPPEALIAYHLLESMGIEFKLDYEHLVDNGVSFYMNDLLVNDIEILWVKHNDANIIESHSDRQIYLY
jgi:hypothetical protein